MYKRCKLCQKFFTTLNKQSVYCVKCRGKKKYYLTKERIEKECAYCGFKFFTTNKLQKFHSVKCRNKFHENKTAYNKVCKLCKKSFTTTNNNKLYCCPEHYLIAKRERDYKNYLKRKS